MVQGRSRFTLLHAILQYFSCTIYMGRVEPLHSSFSIVVMFTNKMNLIKPFILLCFLYGVILIAAVVAGEPWKDEEKGMNLNLFKVNDNNALYLFINYLNLLKNLVKKTVYESDISIFHFPKH